MGAREKLAESARNLKGILSWRAWTDNEALQVLEWIERAEFPATATEALVEHARLARAVAKLKAALDRLHARRAKPDVVAGIERLLEEAELQLECHDTEFCQYAPLFPYVEPVSTAE